MSRFAFRLRSAAGATALVLLATLCVSIGAQADEVPAPSGDVTSDYAFVGDPLRGMASGEAGSLFGRSPDFIKGMASTTKSWAMYLVCKGIDDGVFGLDSKVWLSENALIPRGHGHSAMSGPGVPEAGDYYRMEDLLHSIMIDSASDGTLGAAEYLSGVYQPTLNSAEREAYFVEYMNLAAQSIGLEDTQFYNPYGGDHAHTNRGGTGDSVNHVSTAREMAMWFAHAQADSETFRQISAYRGDLVFSDWDATKWHQLNSYNPGYPGLLGHKPGGNASCDSCLVGGARRIGRDMAFGVMESDNQWTDEVELLDYAYEATFNPQLHSESEDWDAVKDYALATVGSTRAVHIRVRRSCMGWVQRTSPAALWCTWWPTPFWRANARTPVVTPWCAKASRPADTTGAKRSPPWCWCPSVSRRSISRSLPRAALPPEPRWPQPWHWVQRACKSVRGLR